MGHSSTAISWCLVLLVGLHLKPHWWSVSGHGVQQQQTLCTLSFLAEFLFAVIILKKHLFDDDFFLPFWASPSLPTRIYCITDIDPDHRKLSQLEAVIRFLTGEEPDLECKFSSSQRPCWVFLYLSQRNENCEADWYQAEFPRLLFMLAGLNLSLA